MAILPVSYIFGQVGCPPHLYQIRMISYCKSLRLERSGRKQSQGLREITSYRIVAVDDFSARFLYSPNPG